MALGTEAVSAITVEYHRVYYACHFCIGPPSIALAVACVLSAETAA